MPVKDDVLTKGRDKSKKSLPTLRTRASAVKQKDLLSKYLKEIRRYEILSPEEEKKIALRLVEDGDREAAQALITANLRLVVKIAYQYHRQWANVLDLIQEGNIGLVEALERYDPYRNVRFSSYAQYWIRAMVLRFLMDNFRMVKLGNTRAGRKLFFQLHKERERLAAEGIEPSRKRIAEGLGVSEKEVALVDQHMRSPALSLHAPIGDDAEGRTLSDVVTDTETLSPEVRASNAELGALVSGKLQEFAESLTEERDWIIWTQRLLAEDPVSLSTLGEQFSVSKERVRQLEVRIKKRLQVFLTSELGEDVDFEFLRRGS